ncbi:carboxyl transferase domain-containing protein [Oceanirhabdus sp. W0125-5]|uniref:carboxyl transferase domain-containing protein n=1 Tax=Oceanirhabdus sp. W0125-5 TaxID=2999116 RepID=UPI0022F32176|nr:carboxyl transferase domain-containing protein [Oceanirhabdus sp. W0125-5]WBW97947.1 carboxyl transferase domain-containing protein [Oceanirhabdus sp. W0125-5]
MDKVDNLAEIKAKALDDRKVDLQHNLNKGTARERILSILDEGSFIEIGAMFEKNGGGIIGGHGTINGRLAFICSHDYTVNGGAINRKNGEKICRIMDMAVEMGAPLIQMYDSIGANISEGLDVIETYGKILKRNAKLSGVIPHIAVIAGPAKGIDSLSAGMSDFVFVVEENAEMSLNSEMKMTEREGRYITKEELSSSDMCLNSGTAQIKVINETELREKVRKLVTYMPSNNKGIVPQEDECYDLNNINLSLNEMVNNEEIKIEDVIEQIIDNNSLIEINKNFEGNTITALSKINGLTVGIIGIKGNEDENITINTCEKISRFVKICDNFSIPMVNVVNSKGFVASLSQERQGLSIMGSKLMSAIGMSDVGKVSLIVGDAIGASYLAFASKEFAYDFVYAWPSARISAGDPIEMIKRDFADAITNSEIPKKEEEKIIDEKLSEYIDPYKAAYAGFVDDVIEPGETKARLFAVLDMLQTKRVLKYPKKHGSHLI